MAAKFPENQRFQVPYEVHECSQIKIWGVFMAPESEVKLLKKSFARSSPGYSGNMKILWPEYAEDFNL